MLGGQQAYKFRGVIPRAISQIFHEVQSKPELSYVIRVSYAEIYNELIYDLISPTPPSDQSGSIMIQDDPKYGITLRGLSQSIVNTEEEALNQLFEGETNRTIAAHLLNKNSTRSHCVYTVHLESRSRVESSEKVTISKLNLVDLAGSERTKKTGSEGLTLTEANYINKSLSYLEQVVIALSERGREHVPYRQSKLTYMLKDSIGGNSKTLMVANIWPEPSHMEETISTLRFATRMMRVSNEATINVELDPAQLIERYKREIRDLKQELAMHDTLANRGRIVYEPYTPEQQYQQQQVAESFLDGDTDEVEFDSLRQVRELFIQMRNIYRRALSRLGASDFKVRADKEVDRSGSSHPKEQKNIEESDEGLGDEENFGGFGLGRANPNAKPMDTSALEPRTHFMQAEEEEINVNKSLSFEENKKKSSGSQRKQPIDKNQAFMEFKNVDGRDINNALNQNREDHKDKKARLKEVGARINRIKSEIDECKEKVEQIRRNKPSEEEDVIDEEEFEYIKRLKDLKKVYRVEYDQMKNLKEEVNMIAQSIEFSRERLINEFEAWYERKFGGTTMALSRENFGTLSEMPANMEGIEEIDDVDPDALAFIKAKNNVKTLHKAKKALGSTLKK
mmetsp:Transcript_14032/g.14066  ORF Transcript_14032/g.14066 Transcript_14032/m.14066 type:complete len:623 (+) Transcript_14032:287-2155(+)